jgi:tricorn protease
MTHRHFASLSFGTIVFWSTFASAQVDVRDTRFLGQPAISADRIAFTYADDLWTARPDGSDVKRITSHPGIEMTPYFSPDGKTLAFTGQYDGNPDVFIVPTEGGAPKRLTHHPGPDVVRGWMPNGSAVLFASPRSTFSNRYMQFFTVSPDGGTATRLKVPNGFKGSISPDGKYLAYTPLSEPFRQWKHYRGGSASRIWVLDLDDLSVWQVPQPEGRCNDTDPMWIGSTIYFLSDRDGEFNLYSVERKGKDVERLTEHADFPIEDASAGAGKVIYEQAGYLHVYDPKSPSKTPTRLKIGVAADLIETRSRLASGDKFLRSASISPAGKRAAFEFRGEVVTVPAKKGDVRNLTQTPAVHERSPVWSPDGKSLAYFSDAGGEYTLHVRPQDGSSEAKSYPLKGAGFYERAAWSPDSKKIAFIDNSRTVSWIDLETGNVKKVASEAIYGPVNTMSFDWSPDSKWLAYTLTNAASFQTLRIYSTTTDTSRTLNDGLAETAEPKFDASGKYLYFLASTDAGPVKNWFDQSNADMRATHSLYVAVLRKDLPSPLRKLSDEEGAEEVKPKDKDKDKEEKPVETTIDFDGLSDRVLAIPVPTGDLSNLAIGTEGQVYFLRSEVVPPGASGPDGAKPKTALHHYDLKKLEDEVLAEGVEQFAISADRKKILYHAGSTWGIADLGKFKAGDGSLAVSGIAVKIDPRAEWPQIFREAWRINRDYFYAKNMHGADWDAIYKKYEPLVSQVPTRGDLNRVIRMMCSELAVGHSYLSGGDRLYDPKPVGVGLLGADFEVRDGRYRLSKVYGGLNWDAKLRAPLKAPGVDVKAGEYLLAVDGKDLKSDEDLFSRFEDKVGKLVSLKVGPNADGTGARTVVVEPIANEFALRNRDWVEGNLKKVHDRTGGRAAYVYVPNTADLGHEYFKRYFFPQAGKDAIIVDERFNGGGSVADYYIDMLRRPYVSSWAMRHGADIRTPGAAILGPKVMLIDETAGSGGDLLPWMFRKFTLGPLVGKRTWGGLVGILGFPVLMDGGAVTAPDLAFYTEEGYGVENVGVPPDVEVEQWPADVEAGKDPQLDRAIEILLKELEKNPPKSVKRPPDPVKTK